MNIILEQKSSWNYSPRVTTEESGLIVTRQMLPAHPAPSPPQQPRGKDCLLCSGLPASVLGDVSAPAPHGLPSASLRLCSKDPVSLGSPSSVGDWALNSHPPKETSATSECRGSQPGSSLRVERPIFYVKAGAGSVCEKKVCGGGGG